jgi:hypothetical protein
MKSRDEFRQFLGKWSNRYANGLQSLPLFDAEVTREWAKERQTQLAGALYHMRGHFGQVLWEVAVTAPEATCRHIILDRIHDELGATGTNQERLYTRLANSVGCDLRKERYDPKYYLPVLRTYNDAKIRAIHGASWAEILVGLGLGEHLDTADYAKVRKVFESFGVAREDLSFFDAHAGADRFGGALEDAIVAEWEKNPEFVKSTFEQGALFQSMIWQELSRVCCSGSKTARDAAPSTTLNGPAAKKETVVRGSDGLRRHLQYDFENSPAMAGKFADLVALNNGDPSYLALDFDERTSKMLPMKPGDRRWGESTLIFGSTGFIGCHLLHRVLHDPKVKRAYAIVRGRGDSSPEERILSQWREYELSESVIDMTKLVVLEGDLTSARFGLSEEQYTRLAHDVDTVFHTAGSTDYKPGYPELRQDWVLGMLGTVQFCFDQSPKQLCYIGSTIAHLYSTPEDFYRKDDWWYSGYAQMKWVNQAIIQQLHAKGMRAQVCEAPYVLGSTSVGKDPSQHYTLWRLITMMKAVKFTMGVVPDVAPVDYLTDATVINAFLDDPLPVIRPTYPVPLGIEEFASLLGCEVLPWEEGMERLRAYATPAQLRLAPEPAIIEKTNLEPIYPPGYDWTGGPSGIELARFYLRQQNLL